MIKSKFFTIIICFLCCICLLACGKGETNNQETLDSTSEVNSSSNIVKESADSLNIVKLREGYVLILDTLMAHSTEIKEVSSKIDKISSFPYRTYLIVMLAWLLIITIFVVIIFSENNKLSKKLNKLDDNLRKVNKLVNELNENAKNNVRQNTAFYGTGIVNRNNTIKQNENTLNNKKESQQQITEKKEENEGVQAYFGTVINSNPPYFRDILYKKNEEARFSAIKKGDKVEFEPLSIDLVKSFDNIRFAINIVGERREDATRMDVIKKGIAELNGGKWVIKSNVEILLIK